MKTIHIFLILAIILLSSCTSGVKSESAPPESIHADFGIHEIVLNNELPALLVDSLKANKILLNEEAHQVIVGYQLATEATGETLNISVNNVKLIRSSFLVGDTDKYYLIIAVKQPAGMSNADIQSTKARKQNVEIRFTVKGAVKWAEMTKKNTGKQLAFVINNQVYSMPLVNAEINEGIAMITGLSDEALAKSIAEALNAK